MFVEGEMPRSKIQELLGLADKKNFIKKYLVPAIQLGLVELTIPEKPNSRLQKYRLTNKGQTFKKLMEKTNQKY
jgi:hypothetical protein